MRKLIDVGTDIATIGLWDPAHERHDLKSAKYNDYVSALEGEATAGRLFFMRTGSDGSFPIEFFVEETPGTDLLDAYTTTEREYLIISESGRLIAGGLEDFIAAIKQITSKEDEFNVPIARYALKLYELDEEIMDQKLQRAIGAEDYDYYQKRYSGFSWGCLLFAVAAILSLLGYSFITPALWYASLCVFVIWIAYMFIRSKIESADQRFQEISRQVRAHVDSYPGLLIVLSRLSKTSELKGGWHDLE